MKTRGAPIDGCPKEQKRNCKNSAFTRPKPRRFSYALIAIIAYMSLSANQNIKKTGIVLQRQSLFFTYLSIGQLVNSQSIFIVYWPEGGYLLGTISSTHISQILQHRLILYPDFRFREASWQSQLLFEEFLIHADAGSGSFLHSTGINPPNLFCILGKTLRSVHICLAQAGHIIVKEAP